ncbi:carbohydrate kinase, YjeF related protein, partial [sediment metagenome]
MQRAGLAAAEAARAMAADNGAPILVVAGPGNNGGDAWVAAAHLREAFHRVTVLDFAGSQPKAPEAREARDRFLAAGGKSVREWPADIRPALVVDGLLGIGLARDVEGEMARLILRINACGAPVLAIDVPSGIASDTGAVRGVAVRATRTITFLARKAGLYTGAALDHAGRDRRGRPWRGPGPACRLPRQPPHAASLRGRAAGARARYPQGILRRARRRRRRQGHGGGGHPRGARRAARGRGQGVRGPPRARCPLLRPGHAGADAQARGRHHRGRRARRGAGRGPFAQLTSLSAFERSTLPALLSLPKPLVLDADALNAIALHDTMRDALAANRRAPTILTPHPAEAARLLRCETAEVQADRLAAALSLAESFKAEVVLKGAGSVCASPDGTWAVNATGNPGLASGGTGDVLSGIVGALLCQGLPAREALRYAVCLHGAAADS